MNADLFGIVDDSDPAKCWIAGYVVGVKAWLHVPRNSALYKAEAGETYYPYRRN
jgi:hypothetical protein